MLADDPGLHSEVQMFYDGVVRTWNARDWQGIAGLFTDDAELLLQGSPVVQGIENISSFFQQTINFSTYVFCCFLDVCFDRNAGRSRSASSQPHPATAIWF